MWGDYHNPPPPPLPHTHRTGISRTQQGAECEPLHQKDWTKAVWIGISQHSILPSPTPYQWEPGGKWTSMPTQAETEWSTQRQSSLQSASAILLPVVSIPPTWHQLGKMLRSGVSTPPCSIWLMWVNPLSLEQHSPSRIWSHTSYPEATTWCKLVSNFLVWRMSVRIKQELNFHPTNLHHKAVWLSVPLLPE